MNYIGEIAAIGTSFCFTVGPIFFATAGKKVGAIIVNRSRLVFAVLILLIIHQIYYGNLLPENIESYRWVWLSVSGLVGLTLGDSAFFQALVMIGPRLTLLIFAVSPVIGTILGWFFLNESLGPWQFIGIFITLAGVTWVISKQENGTETDSTKKNILLGLFYALLGAIGQAVGLLTAKMGLAGDFPVLSGQIIRMLAGTIFLWIWTIFKGESKETIRVLLKESQALKIILIATLIGPVLGVWLSLVSVQNAELGIASTLQALPPIFLIPISIIFFKEKLNWQSIAGTIVSLIGVSLLFLV